MPLKTKLSKEFYLALQEYINRNYVEEKQEEEYRTPLFGKRRDAKSIGFTRPKAVAQKEDAPEIDFGVCK